MRSIVHRFVMQAGPRRHPIRPISSTPDPSVASKLKFFLEGNKDAVTTFSIVAAAASGTVFFSGQVIREFTSSNTAMEMMKVEHSKD